MAERPMSSASLSLAAATPLPLHSDDFSFRDPQPHFLDSRTPSSVGQGARESAMYGSTAGLGVKNEASSSLSGELEGAAASTKSGKKRSLLLAVVALIVLIVIVLAVMLPVYFTVIKPKQRNTGSSQPDTSGTTTHHTTAATPTHTAAPPQATSGGDGSLITLANGTTFTYVNKFGGQWYADPNDPYNDSAQPNSWTPPLNQPFDYAATNIFGVNLGGLFVLEPFITPALFQKYPGTIDEWSLTIAMAADTASGGTSQLEDHYKTFVTELDIAEIAGAGLNFIRLPVPFWAIEVFPGEPFLEGVSWKYIVQVFQWCRKYGIRVNLDLHNVPGSANGYNHGGKSGSQDFLNGVMGYANSQRGINYVRILTEFISQPEWKNVVPMFSILNEPLVTTIGQDTLRSYYIEAFTTMRAITGYGTGNGPFMVLHDSFQGLDVAFTGFMPGADRVGGDVHPYFAFDGSTTAATIDTGTGAGAGGTWPLAACTRFGTMMNDSRNSFGVAVAGEWSNAFLDCGTFLHGVDGTPTYAGDCTTWDDSSTWSAGTKAGIQAFASAQMDNLGDYFFWTWKIAPAQSGIVESPLWSYQLGLQNGWMPADPRSVIGTCQTLGGPTGTFTGFQPYMTGGTGAGAPTDAGKYPWPPANIAGVGAAPAALPSYTPTGTIATLAAPTYTNSKGNAISGGNGWFDASDTTPEPTLIAGCTYPDAWNSENAAIPPLCAGA